MKKSKKNDEDTPMEFDQNNIEEIMDVNNKKKLLKKNITIMTANKNAISFVNDNEREIFQAIDEIVDSLKTFFEGKRPEEILDALRLNSFNLENTYLFLLNPEAFKGILYVFI